MALGHLRYSWLCPCGLGRNGTEPLAGRARPALVPADGTPPAPKGWSRGKGVLLRMGLAEEMSRWARGFPSPAQAPSYSSPPTHSLLAQAIRRGEGNVLCPHRPASSAPPWATLPKGVPIHPVPGREGFSFQTARGSKEAPCPFALRLVPRGEACSEGRSYPPALKARVLWSLRAGLG